MSPFEFLCAGERLEAWPTGALHWPSRRLLAVADLHLEKGSSYAVNALKLLPRHDTRQTLAMLSALIDRLQPETVVCLGDSFHDRSAIERLPKAERAEIERLTRRTRFVWIAGNHDPSPPPSGCAALYWKAHVRVAVAGRERDAVHRQNADIMGVFAGIGQRNHAGANMRLLRRALTALFCWLAGGTTGTRARRRTASWIRLLKAPLFASQTPARKRRNHRKARKPFDGRYAIGRIANSA